MDNNEINQANKFTFSEELLKQLQRLVQDVNVERLNRSLRNVLLDYLRHEIDMLPLEFDAFLGDIYVLFELLDMAIDETRDSL